MAENFFLDLQTLGWTLTELDDFMVAAWARGRVQGGTKSSAQAARETLILVQAATDVSTFVESPLVRGQLIKPLRDDVPDEAEQAKELPVETLVKIESLVFYAPTGQQRCFCGFFALLASSSLRTTDGLRTRRLALTKDAITGVSQMKTKSVWTRWYADRGGFGASEWASRWMEELQENGLPGKDFVLLAPSATMDRWLDRPAEYADVRRALHFILMSQCGMTASEAVTYSPHGFRHLLITIGQQLRTQGVVTEGDIERLGHWAKDSSMVRRYDTSAGVSELSARSTLLRAVREGWRPVSDGTLPNPLPSTPGAQALVRSIPQTPISYGRAAPAGRVGQAVPSGRPCFIRVGHRTRKRVHLVSEPHRVSMCGMWTCGTRSDPVAHALYEDIPLSWPDCRNCERGVGKSRHGDGNDATAVISKSNPTLCIWK